jgi:hypothetical protein
MFKDKTDETPKALKMKSLFTPELDTKYFKVLEFEGQTGVTPLDPHGKMPNYP